MSGAKPAGGELEEGVFVRGSAGRLESRASRRFSNLLVGRHAGKRCLRLCLRAPLFGLAPGGAFACALGSANAQPTEVLAPNPSQSPAWRWPLQQGLPALAEFGSFCRYQEPGCCTHMKRALAAGRDGARKGIGLGRLACRVPPSRR